METKGSNKEEELGKGLKARKPVGKFLSSCKEDMESKKHLMDDQDANGNELKADIDVGHVKLEKIPRRSQPC